GYGSFSAVSTASCPTNDNGGRTVKGSVKDKDGGVSEYTALVTINNVAPTATLANDGPVFEGSPATITFSAQSDPSSADTTAGFHYAYACDGDTSSLPTTYSGLGTTISTSTACTYDDGPSTHTVAGRIFHKDSGYCDYTTTVTVNNVAPTATFNSPASV